MRLHRYNMTASSLTHEMAVRGISCVIVALRKFECFDVPEENAGIGRYCWCMGLNGSSRRCLWTWRDGLSGRRDGEVASNMPFGCCDTG